MRKIASAIAAAAMAFTLSAASAGPAAASFPSGKFKLSLNNAQYCVYANNLAGTAGFDTCAAHPLNILWSYDSTTQELSANGGPPLETRCLSAGRELVRVELVACGSGTYDTKWEQRTTSDGYTQLISTSSGGRSNRCLTFRPEEYYLDVRRCVAAAQEDGEQDDVNQHWYFASV
ncbi:hypothetical protein [Streptomyces sp. NPDC057199]|uniref:hypothetical protein n=1 Tax=Streptomyces sp. NPDC057199 TaxID=3346047 RepID=UPI0036448B72